MALQEKHNQAQAVESGAYRPVEISTLRVGMLLDCGLSIFLAGNGRYVSVARELYPLEAHALGILTKSGKAFTRALPLAERYPELEVSAAETRKICDDPELAPFEKVTAIVEKTRWLFPHVQKASSAVPLFIHRAFGVPAPETLTFLTDLSVEMYERMLKASSLAGVLALWLGYCDSPFISQLVEGAFCEEVGIYRDGARLDPRSSAELALLKSRTTELVRAGEVPGVKELDRRILDGMAQDRPVGVVPAFDEVFDILALGRMLAKGEAGGEAAASRVARKLWQNCGLEVVTVAAGSGAAGAKEAA